MTNTLEEPKGKLSNIINIFSSDNSIPKVKVIKKDGTKADYSISKVINAINKSATRVLYKFTDNEIKMICNYVNRKIKQLCKPEISICEIHNIVEAALEVVNPEVAKNYRDYRNYKTDFVGMLDKVYQESQRIMYIGDKENANSDATLVSTKRSLIFNELNKQLYKKFFLTTEELQAARDGYIYIHDMSARRDTINCCLFDIQSVLSGGFEMGNIWYNEPKSLDVAFDVIGDITMSAASQQYGGFTIPEADKILAPYAQKSYDRQYSRYISLGLSEEKAKEEAMKDVTLEMEQGFQGWEYKFNTVASSRGDYPFITVTLGLGTSQFEKMATLACLKTRMGGQGKKENKKPVLFPKIVLLYDENLHGYGKPLEDVYHAAVECSKKTMYPDWLSLTGEGYVASMYKKYKKVVSPMGCVESQEVVTYKINDTMYVESFERFWNRVSALQFPIGQAFEQDINKFIDCTKLNISIWDNKKQDFVKVTKLIRNKQDNWCQVSISNGRILTCTTDHPFETENRGMVYAKDLTPEDIIGIDTKQYTTNNINYDCDRAWLEAFMLCDGCYQNHSIFASVAAIGEDDLAEACKTLMEKYFKLPASIKLYERQSQGNYKNIHAYSDGKDGLNTTINYLTELFGGIQKNNRHIPNKVFSFQEEARYAFLAGMIDADGYVAYNHNKTNCKIQLGSVNKELAIQQALLAQSLGLRAQIYKTHYKGNVISDKVSYKIEFYPNAKLINALKCAKKKERFIETAKDKNAQITQGFIKSVTLLDKQDFSYDVSTESEHFTVSGIYSHNCRAFLSPWYKNGGIHPIDENDVPVFVGRFNIGAISLHLPMILAKSRQEGKDFYKVLDYYMEMIRNLHRRTLDYLGEMKASINPLAYCEGGFLGGHLKPNEKIRPVLQSTTASFGITALNELQELYNGKSLVEDGEFALEVMKHINDKVAEYKEQDNYLYALYGSPAETLCFSGNSLISTIDGYKSISEIKKGDLVYSYNETSKKIELKPVLASKQTQEHAVVVKIITDNGQEFICTPEHPFAVRCVQDLTKGSKLVSEYIKYVSARDLKPGMRLKSCYAHQDKDGRIYYNSSSDRKNYRHIINATYKYGNIQQGFQVHHIDENKQNDSLDNLQLLTIKEHRQQHYNDVLKSYQFIAGKNSGINNAFYGRKHTEEAKAANRAAHIGKSIVRVSLDYKPLEYFECADDADKAGYTRHRVVQCCRGQYQCGGESKRKYKNSYWFYEEDCKQLLEANHKVVSVEYLQELIPVYNIEVADNNNYYVGGDQAVLVHNCGLQVKQFREKYGVVHNVSDKPYVSNSFHCHVTEDITPIQKQDLEGRFWDLMNGGKIQYVRYPINYNTKAVETLINRAMKKGFYEGVNLSLAYCDDCGHQELEMDVCPKCGSRNLTKIDRMNGYLAYSRVKGDSRLADHKMKEIHDRKSM